MKLPALHSGSLKLSLVRHWRAYCAVLVIISFCIFGLGRTVTQLAKKHTPEIESTYSSYYDERFGRLRTLSPVTRFGFVCVEDNAPSMDCLRDYFLAQYELAPRLVDFQQRDVTIAEADKKHNTTTFQTQEGYSCLRELSNKYSVLLFRTGCPELPLAPSKPQ